MTKAFVNYSLVGILSIGMLGCGENVSPPSEIVDTAEQTLDGKAGLKTLLTTVSESGSLGSGSAGVRNTIEGLKSSDEALATSLLGELDKLQAAEGSGDQNKVKSIAASMAKKL